MATHEPTRPPRPRWRRRLTWMLAAVLIPPALFTWNGLVLARSQTPTGSISTSNSHEVAADDAPSRGPTVKILAWNLAKCFLHHGGLSFAEPAKVRSRLEAIAAVIQSESPDLVFLSEIVTECTLCNVDQLAFLRERTGLGAWAFGENYNFGLPFCRIAGGNAILARFPLTDLRNRDLAGRRPFYVTRNNRRVLLATTRIQGRDIRLGSIHTDSFDRENNRRQTEQIISLCRGTEALLAGDFNAEPDSASLLAIVATGRFSGAVAGAATFPADAPRMRIDYIFAPRTWKLIEHRVLDDRTSDHRPVVSVFRAPRRAAGGK